jgi:hypothetical protein
MSELSRSGYSGPEHRLSRRLGASLPNLDQSPADSMKALNSHRLNSLRKITPDTGEGGTEEGREGGDQYTEGGREGGREGGCRGWIERSRREGRTKGLRRREVYGIFVYTFFIDP